MADVMAYVKENYEEGEAIFPENVAGEMNVPVSDVTQELTAGVVPMDVPVGRYGAYLRRYEKDVPDDVFYLSMYHESVFGPSETYLSPEDYIAAKYIERRGRVFGYYAGLQAANIFGLSTQVPAVAIFASNLATSDVEEKGRVGGFRFFMSRPRATVTDENAPVLQFLDMLDRADYYTDKCDFYTPRENWRQQKWYFRRWAKAAIFDRKLFYEMMELYDGQAKEKFIEFNLDNLLV